MIEHLGMLFSLLTSCLLSLSLCLVFIGEGRLDVYECDNIDQQLETSEPQPLPVPRGSIYTASCKDEDALSMAFLGAWFSWGPFSTVKHGSLVSIRQHLVVVTELDRTMVYSPELERLQLGGGYRVVWLS